MSERHSTGRAPLGHRLTKPEVYQAETLLLGTSREHQLGACFLEEVGLIEWSGGLEVICRSWYDHPSVVVNPTLHQQVDAGLGKDR